MTGQPLWLRIGVPIGLVAGVVIAFVLLRDRPSPTSVPSGVTNSQIVAARDEAVTSAQHAAAVLHSIDYHTAADSADQWQSVATGALLANLRSGRDGAIAAARTAHSVALAYPRAAAASRVADDVTSVDVLVVLEVKASTGDAAPGTRDVRVRLTMIRDQQWWKVSAFTDLSPGG